MVDGSGKYLDVGNSENEQLRACLDVIGFLHVIIGSSMLGVLVVQVC